MNRRTRQVALLRVHNSPVKMLCWFVACLSLIGSCRPAVVGVNGSADAHIAARGWPVLTAPGRLAAEAPPLYPPLTADGQLLYGAYALQQHAGARVAAVGHRLRFDPAWDPAPGGTDRAPAYAIFSFNLVVFDGLPEVSLAWEGAAPEPGELYVGLGNFDRGTWDWYPAPATGPLVLDDLTPYLNAESRLLLALVVLGQTSHLLESAQVGEPWIHEGVDLTRVFAPPVTAEIDALAADYALRDTAAREVTIIGDDSANPDGYRRVVLSHTVNGYKHYAAVRMPFSPSPGQHMVVLYLHPGNYGVATTQDQQLSWLLQDVELDSQLLVVIPSFRSEELFTNAYGSLRSEGPSGMYDYDADDTLALLNVVLANFPECDPNLIIAIGYSRGAQVAQRVGERDPRIKAVAEIAGWTDEWCQPAQSYMLGSLSNVAEVEPDPSDVFTHFYWDLRYGTGDSWAARAEMLRWSTVYLADHLPRVQIHHGEFDQSIPLDQGERLYDTLSALPGANVEYFVYAGGNHNITSLDGLSARLKQLLVEVQAGS